MRLALFWGLGLAMVVGVAGSCGAVTLEPLPPEEPLPEAGPPPRLMRRDAGLPTQPEEEDTR